MPVRINIPRGQVQARVNDAFRRGLPLLTATIRDGCNEYCKEDKGYLKESSMIHSVLSEGKIVWQQPYAKRQYWEIRTAFRDENPKATWKWAEVAKSHLMGEWERQAQEAMERFL